MSQPSKPSPSSAPASPGADLLVDLSAEPSSAVRRALVRFWVRVFEVERLRQVRGRGGP